MDPHQNYYSDWETPPEWVGWARRTMGDIDLDPCSPSSGTFATTAGYTAESDGLAQPWFGRVYCNPPGANSSKSVKAWWAYAQQQSLEALVFAFFNCEAVKSVTPCAFDVPGYLVIPTKRISWWRDGQPGKSPRNWAWFWSSKIPAVPPLESRIIRTGIAALDGLVLGSTGQ